MSESYSIQHVSAALSGDKTSTDQVLTNCPQSYRWRRLPITFGLFIAVGTGLAAQAAHPECETRVRNDYINLRYQPSRPFGLRDGYMSVLAESGLADNRHNFKSMEAGFSRVGTSAQKVRASALVDVREAYAFVETFLPGCFFPFAACWGEAGIEMRLDASASSGGSCTDSEVLYIAHFAERSRVTDGIRVLSCDMAHQPGTVDGVDVKVTFHAWATVSSAYGTARLSGDVQHISLEICPVSLQPGDEVQGVGDFDGDGRSDFILRGADYLGIVGLDDSGRLKIIAIIANDGRFGGQWRLQQGDEVQGVGDFDGDGRSDEFIIRSAGYLGIVGLDDSGRPASLAILANGDRFGGQWRLQGGDEVQGVGDFNGDGRSDFIIRSSDHLGMVGLDDSGRPASLAILHNGDRFGGQWRLQGGDEVQGVGDFNGDGRSDFIIRSGGYLGMVGLDDSGRPASLAILANDDRFGGQWRLQGGDEVQGVGDFNGDGRGDLIIRSSGYLGMVGLDDSGRSTSLAILANGNRFGGQWRLQRSDEVQGVGNFNGEGGSDFIIRSAGYLGMVGLDDSGRPASLAILANGDRFGGQWRLQGGDKVQGVGDFNGDGRSDFIIRSGGYLGIVGLDNSDRPTSLAIFANGDHFVAALAPE